MIMDSLEPRPWSPDDLNEPNPRPTRDNLPGAWLLAVRRYGLTASNEHYDDSAMGEAHREWCAGPAAHTLEPSELQREFDAGDPDGKVQAAADAILAEIERDERK